VPAAGRAVRFLTKWREVKDRLPIARLLNTVFVDSGYDAAMQFEFLGDRKLANLWKLVELARTFDRTGLFGLHEFTARLGYLVARQPREEQAATLPENADVVRLMSIHQAKGLEFPVVFVPDIAATTRGNVHPVARWHRGLGCLVRLPAEFDEYPDEAPFPDFADRLGKTADQLADWQEDLRILYVACTRARDLLILSAGLPGGVESVPANHWTLALGERFDLRTGRCVADDVPPEDVPLVRVSVVAGGEEVRSQTVDRRADQTRPEVRPWVSPQPPSLPQVVSLPALERLARGEPLPSLGEPFDTESDGDRSEWRQPRERLGPVSPAEAVLWNVLERWDFRDVDGWAQLLADAAGDNERVAAGLRPMLRQFAESEARTALATATDLRRGVEFLADLGAVVEAQEPRQTVRGLIDFLYRNSNAWHILGIDLGTADEDDPWRGRRPGLVLQAWALWQQFGEWPRTINLFDLATGQLVTADPRKVKLAAVADHFRRVVARLSSNGVPRGSAG
jgi:ATP-dependent exoDNAse (exonuclease V) beta subunit